MWDKIVKYIGAICGGIMGIFGEWNMMLTILVYVMLIDFVSGVIVSACGKSHKTDGGGLSSKVGFVGLAKKSFIMLVVLLATLLDKSIGGTSMIFQSAATAYYIANEGLSILENAALMGIPFPEVIKNALEELKDKNVKDKDIPDR